MSFNADFNDTSILHSYKISPLLSNYLPMLANFKLIIIADNSFTLSNSMKTGKSRWYEIVKYIEVASDIFNNISSDFPPKEDDRQNCFELDIHLLNRSSPVDLSTIFSTLPAGTNLISTKLREILNVSYNNYAGCKIIILTDGEIINNYIGEYWLLRRILIDTFQPTNSITFITCTDNQKCINAINELSTDLPHVDVINVYIDEYQKFIKINSIFENINGEFSYCDYVVDSLIKHLIDKKDKNLEHMSILNLKSEFYDYSKIGHNFMDNTETVPKENKTSIQDEVLVKDSNVLQDNSIANKVSNKEKKKTKKRKGQCIII